MSNVTKKSSDESVALCEVDPILIRKGVGKICKPPSLTLFKLPKVKNKTIHYNAFFLLANISHNSNQTSENLF